MGTLFEDTAMGLLQAISIEKGNIPLTEVSNMPATTFRVINEESKETTPKKQLQ